jgi:hypothetical protein
MTKAEQRIRDAQRIAMIEAMLQDYQVNYTGSTQLSGEPYFKYTSEEILETVLQHYPEELTKRINRITDGPKAREMILVEIQKRARRMRASGLTAGFRPRDNAIGKPRNLTPQEVADWFKNLKNVTMMSYQQMDDVVNALKWARSQR